MQVKTVEPARKLLGKVRDCTHTANYEPLEQPQLRIHNRNAPFKCIAPGTPLQAQGAWGIDQYEIKCLSPGANTVISIRTVHFHPIISKY